MNKISFFKILKNIPKYIWLALKFIVKLPVKAIWPITKNKIIIYLIFLIAWYSWYHFYFSKKNEKAPENTSSTIEVTKWVINNSINSFWTSNLVYEQKLNFSEIWKVTKVLVDVWNEVKKWDLLVELDTNTVLWEISKAQIAVDNAKMTLTKLINDKKNYDNVKLKSDIEIAKLKIKEAQNDFDKLESTLSNDQLKKSQELDKAKVDLEILNKTQISDKSDIDKKVIDLKDSIDESSKKLLDTNKELDDLIKYLPSDLEKLKLDKENKILTYNQTLKNTYMWIKNSISSIESTLEDVNNIIWVEKNSSWEISKNIYFSAKSSTYKNISENNYYNVKSKLLDLNKLVNSVLIDNVTVIDLQKMYDSQALVYLSLSDLWDSMYYGYLNSIETSDFSTSDISSWKSSMLSLKSSSYSSYNTSKQEALKILDIDDFSDIERANSDEVKKKNDAIEIKKDEIKKLQTSLEKQQSDYKLALTKVNEEKWDVDAKIEKQKTAIFQLELELSKLWTWNLITYENKKIELQSLKLELSKLEEKLNSKTDDDIVSAENAVKSAQLDLEQKHTKLENFKILAPFDGKITAIDFKVWDNIEQNASKFVYLVNPNLIEIKINLDQVDIVKVKKWQTAKITFDAFPWVEYEGILWDVSWIASTDQGSQLYPVKVTFTKGKEDIFSWMSAWVSIVMDNKENIITIPQSAIETDLETGEKFVMVDKTWKKEKRIITTWLSWEWIIEVVSGLEVGERIYEVNFDANKFKTEDFYPNNGWGWMWM